MLSTIWPDYCLQPTTPYYYTYSKKLLIGHNSFSDAKKKKVNNIIINSVIISLLSQDEIYIHKEWISLNNH